MLRTGGHDSWLLLDGKPLASGHSGTLSIFLSELSKGTHTLVAKVDRGFPGGTSTTTRMLTVDTRPPALTVVAPKRTVAIKDAVDMSGTVQKGAKVTAVGATVSQSGSTFTAYCPAPRPGLQSSLPTRPATGPCGT